MTGSNHGKKENLTKTFDTIQKSPEPVIRLSREVEPVWHDIIAGKVNIEFEFFAARILQGTLARNFQKNPSAENLAKCAWELSDLFRQNADLPSVCRDLKKILG